MPGVPDVDYKDYYAVLGLTRTASAADIKKAYRKLARKHHPDTNAAGDDAAGQRFKDVNEAHAVLSDPKKRELYDRVGADWEAYARAGAAGGQAGDPFGPGGPFAGFARGGTAPGAGGGNVRYEFRTAGDTGGFSDFFRVFFDEDGAAYAPAGGQRRGTRPSGGASFEEILAGMGLAGSDARAGTHGAAQARPAGAEAIAEISLEEAFAGTTRRVEVGGKRLEVTIPRGVDTGRRIRLSGRAPDGGDLHVVIKVVPDPRFVRRGADLEREVPLTLAEALLGTEITVPTLKGRVLLKIPPGTQYGRTFRLSGQGMPRFNAPGSGDLYVKTRVVLPGPLSDEAAAAARTMFDLIDQPDPRT